MLCWVCKVLTKHQALAEKALSVRLAHLEVEIKGRRKRRGRNASDRALARKLQEEEDFEEDQSANYAENGLKRSKK